MKAWSRLIMGIWPRSKADVASVAHLSLSIGGLDRSAGHFLSPLSCSSVTPLRDSYLRLLTQLLSAPPIPTLIPTRTNHRFTSRPPTRYHLHPHSALRNPEVTTPCKASATNLLDPRSTPPSHITHGRSPFPPPPPLQPKLLQPSKHFKHRTCPRIRLIPLLSRSNATTPSLFYDNSNTGSGRKAASPSSRTEWAYTTNSARRYGPTLSPVRNSSSVVRPMAHAHVCGRRKR